MVEGFFTFNWRVVNNHRQNLSGWRCPPRFGPSGLGIDSSLPNLYYFKRLKLTSTFPNFPCTFKWSSETSQAPARTKPNVPESGPYGFSTKRSSQDMSRHIFGALLIMCFSSRLKEWWRSNFSIIWMRNPSRLVKHLLYHHCLRSIFLAMPSPGTFTNKCPVNDSDSP